MECQQKHGNMFEYTTQPFSGCLNLGMISNDFESGSSLVKWGMGRSTYVCSTRLALWASVKVVKEYMPHMVEFSSTNRCYKMYRTGSRLSSSTHLSRTPSTGCAEKKVNALRAAGFPSVSCHFT